MAPLTSGLLGLAAVLAVNAQSCSNTKTVDYPAPATADGWAYRLVADGFSRPRGIAFDSDGHLIVVDSGNGLIRLTLKDEGGTCVSVDDKTTLTDNGDLNHGLAISSDGKTIYASTSSDVYSWPYSSSSDSLDDDKRRNLVSNMGGSGHTTRTLLLPPSQPGTLLVSLGSESNDDPKALDRKTGISQIRIFDLSKLSENDDPYDYTDGEVLGWGLRNSVGVAEHPEGGIWSVENSVDQLERMGEDIHQDNPGEEMNYHGLLNGTGKEKGGNYGYPTCYTLWGTEDFPERGDLQVGDNFSIDENVSDETCNKDHISPRMAFQAHTAPLDIKFNKNGTQAFVTLHGSWNRDEPVGYSILSIPFENGQPTGDSSSKTSARKIIYTEDLSKCPGECFRPVGMAWDDKERLFFSSDATGEIFVAERSGNGSSSDAGGEDADSSNSSGGEDSNDEDGVNGMVQVAFKSAAWAVTFAALVIGLLLA